MIYTYILIVLACAVLYRLRGSDDIPLQRTQVKRLVYAVATSVMLVPFEYSWMLGLYTWLSVTLVEKSDADYGPQTSTYSPVRLTLYGILDFNPFFGLIHHVTYKYDERFPKLPYLDGHAEWAEFINGGARAVCVIGLWGLVEGLI